MKKNTEKIFTKGFVIKFNVRKIKKNNIKIL